LLEIVFDKWAPILAEIL